ncbi:uncharacterized protein BXZ73DRAFT_96909 [Epithele typhae]|uniref:uncharacterized protein n=1 Tax=Epithele typhae TaxID=378194 RepID=UPI0020072DF4|nr:uncharacterized protein BXZ73DRAFT_96909 [Epithele typhae]KAH9944421.1 hypothetical protein BXZ73DRAFT_96909 [Epithele typhae]
MSVASRNPFALLDDDASRPASPSPAATAKQAAPAATAPAARDGAQKTRGGPASRGGRYYQRGGKTAPRDKENAEAAGDDSEPKKRVDGEGRGRGRGRGRGDRGRGGRGRPFDRHSMTGKTDSDKKVHQGWGGDEGTSELKAEAAAVTDAAAESNEWGAAAPAPDADAWGAGPTDTPAAEGAADEKAERKPREPREPEEDDNTLTLDEYRKKQGGLDIVPKLESRKIDDAAFKDAVVVAKKDEEESAYFVGKTRSAPKTKTKKEEKVFIEIDARFERPARGGRGRGGDRGAERGTRGRGRGGGRGRGANGTGTTTSLNVNDETAFPSLA